MFYLIDCTEARSVLLLFGAPGSHLRGTYVLEAPHVFFHPSPRHCRHRHRTMTADASARRTGVDSLDLAKHDNALVLGGRTFSIRTYLDTRAPDGAGWYVTIIENRIPLSHGLIPTESAEASLDAAIQFLTVFVVASGNAR
jgi:hypothetical protein